MCSSNANLYLLRVNYRGNYRSNNEAAAARYD